MFARRESGSVGRMVSMAAVALILAALTGCGGASPIVNAILDSELRQRLGLPPADTTRIQIINDSELDIELDVLVDNALVTIPCSAEEGRCAYTPRTCPLTVTAVEERRLTPQGVYTGGRVYNNNPAFTFESTEFDCQSVITFTFSDDNTTVQVL